MIAFFYFKLCGLNKKKREHLKFLIASLVSPKAIVISSSLFSSTDSLFSITIVC